METSFSVGFCQFLFCLFLRAGNGAGKDGWRGKVVTAKREKTRYAGVTFRMVARLDGYGKERMYYIRYRRGGRGSKEIERACGPRIRKYDRFQGEPYSRHACDRN